MHLLVIADIHYSPGPVQSAKHPQRKTGLGAELLLRVLRDAEMRGGFDAIALLGDVLDDAPAGGAAGALADLKAQLDKAAPGKPVLVACGNHDPDWQLLPAVFGHSGPVRELGGYRFVCFADRYDGDVCTRPAEQLRLLRDLAASGGDDAGPIVALQHNPISPVIVSDYPFMHTNRDEIMAEYNRAGVLLSLSGHHHAGGPLNRVDDVWYLTAGALCEPPFAYALVELDGRRLHAHRRQLAVPPPSACVWDCHAHTELAYCGVGMSAQAAVHRGELLGLGGVVLTEHAPQLYVPPDDFWHARHIRQPALWRKGGGRMDQFRRLTAPLRGPRVRVGLEVELDADGHLTLRDEDRDVADVLVGAVHWLAGPGESAGRSEAEVMDEFLKTTEALCRAGIDILAHPWRSYMKRGIRPRQHYRHVAAILRETGVAAEINQHLQPSDPEFFAACIEAGVKIALGSDAHEPAAAAALSSHLAIVREIAGDRPLDQVLWQPGQNIR